MKYNSLEGRSIRLIHIIFTDNFRETRMTTFIKTKFKIGLMWSRESFEESTISDLESPSNFQVKEKKFIQIGP